MDSAATVPAIEFRKVSKSFGNKVVLQDISIGFEPGKLSILCGLSGSGKSVMLKHVLRLLRPSSGSLHIFGQDIATLNGTQMRLMLRRFGMVFQHGALFDSLTAAENVAFPLREQQPDVPMSEVQERVQGLLTAVGLSDAGDKLPSDLSGGMHRRVALARALVTHPEVILFDVPTTGLDPIMTVVIEDLILETHRKIGYTGVIITHSMETALKIGDTIALIVDGRIHFRGTPDDFRHTQDPAVRQFVEKRGTGPIRIQ